MESAARLPKWRFQRSLDHPVQRVAGLLLDIRLGNFDSDTAPFVLIDKGKLKISSEAGVFRVEYADGHNEFLQAEANAISLQGEWWYRGVYAWKPLGEGTELSLSVYNVAPRFGWIADLMQLRAKKQHERAFHAWVDRLGQRLRRM